MEPHIISCSSRIPFTSAQCSAEIMNLVAMRYFYGMLSIFFTFAPDDIHGLLHIRLSFNHKSNEEFPAIDTVLAQAIQKGDATFMSLPILPQDLRILLAKFPVATAEVFRILKEIVYTMLLKTPLYCYLKRTEPLPAR